MRKNIYNLRTLIVLALLAALGAVFSAFLSIELAPTGFKVVEISLTPVPVMLAGVLFGPLAGGLVGFVADTAGFFMGVQTGAYNPVFSVTMALFGVIAGLFFLRTQKNTAWRMTAMAVVAQVVCSVILNTAFLCIFYPKYFTLFAILPTRAVSALIELPVYAWLLMMLSEALRPIVYRSFRPETT
jgi:ECF transporter S component (folate family)